MKYERISGGLTRAALVGLLCWGPCLGVSTALSPLATQCGPAARALDFWLGDWNVTMDDGSPMATAGLERGVDGCSIVETWRAAGSRGLTAHALWVLDPADESWRRLRSDSRGSVSEYRGQLDGSRLVMSGFQTDAQGNQHSTRETFERRSGDSVSWLLEMDEAGVSVVVGNGWYRRRTGSVISDSTAPMAAGAGRPEVKREARITREKAKSESKAEREPDASQEKKSELPTAAARADSFRQPGDAGAVAAYSTSSNQSEGDRPRGIADRIRIPSPMTLEVELGSVEKLSPGYAWSTVETAPYVCEDVSIKRLSSSLRRSGGSSYLTVQLDFVAEAYLRKAEVTVVLTGADGIELGRQELRGIRAGNAVPSQVSSGSVSKSLVLDLPAEVLDRALAQERRPMLKIVLAVKE